MPTYIYRCKNCNYQFEKRQKMKDEPLIECPQCKGELRRVITGGAGLIGSVNIGFAYENLSEKEKMKIAVTEPKKMDYIFEKQNEKRLKNINKDNQ